MPYKDPILARAAGRKSYAKHGRRPGKWDSTVAGKLLKRNWHLTRTYGITLEQYNALLIAQAGVCKICGRPPKKRPLHVDHNHKTKVIRGLLCFRCNYGLSWFHEDAAVLTRAGEYLK